MRNTFFEDLVERFERLESKLNELDAATGDGDHGTTILKGLRAILKSEDQVAKSFRIEAGGASGSLFSIILGGIEETINKNIFIGTTLKNSAEKISLLGQAKEGDKTMLDALVPAANAANQNPINAINAAAKAAFIGMENTRDMNAKRGRAKYVEGGGVGHIDAGAFSISEILDELNKYNERKI